MYVCLSMACIRAYIFYALILYVDMYVHTYIFIWQRFVMPPRPSILAANFVFYKKKKCQAKHKRFFVGTTEEVSETKGTPVETITTWKFTTVALLSHFHEKPKTFIYMCVCLYVLLYTFGSVYIRATAAVSRFHVLFSTCAHFSQFIRMSAE